MKRWSVATAAILVLLSGPLAGCASPGPTTDTRETSMSLAPTDPLAGLTWRSHASAGTSRLEVAVAVLHGIIFVVGGFDAQGRATPTMEAYTVAKDEWTQRADYLIPVHHAPAVAVGRYVYVLGGYTPNTFTPTSIAARYDPALDAWTPIPSLPEARGAHAAAALHGRIYVVGGVGADGALLSSVHVFDTATNTWATAPAFPSPRDHLAAASHGGKLYVVGGRLQSLTTNTGRLDVFDPPGGAWTEQAGMPTPRGGITAATYREHIVVFGGEESAATFDEVEAYAAATDTWKSLPAMPHPRHGLGSAVWEDRVYTVMGGAESGLSASGLLDSMGP